MPVDFVVVTIIHREPDAGVVPESGAEFCCTVSWWPMVVISVKCGERLSVDVLVILVAE